MRIDVITIFPEYLAPLELSLIGKARRDGLLSLHVHDLRTFTHDRHRTVDDTPVGGGAGMVMKPEPWAAAISHVLAEGRAELAAGADATGSAGIAATETSHAEQQSPLVILPNPAGEPMTQAIAQETSSEPWIVFACGRYEGIDERVYELLADHGVRTRLLSLGDYVLNGGEVAVLAITEAVVRLVPGVLGNPDSIVEESHSQGLLEYPIYTRPATWTDPEGVERRVPEVLLSGDHGRIARWRREQSLERTRMRRPDLLDAAGILERDADDSRSSA